MSKLRWWTRQSKQTIWSRWTRTRIRNSWVFWVFSSKEWESFPHNSQTLIIAAVTVIANTLDDTMTQLLHGDFPQGRHCLPQPRLGKGQGRYDKQISFR